MSLQGSTAQIVIYKGRTTRLPVSLGYDVSDDEITGEIRVNQDPESTLIATWTVEYETDGTDGEIILVLDDSDTAEITQSTGWTDLKRVTAGEPVPVFDEVLEVLFKNTVTA